MLSKGHNARLFSRGSVFRRGRIGSQFTTQISPIPYRKVVLGEAYSYNVAIHYAGNHTFVLAPGSPPLPDGLTLYSDGTLSGTATVAGMNQQPVIRATNDISGLSADTTVLLSVAQRPGDLPAPVLTELTSTSFRITKPTLPANTPAITSIDILRGPTLPLSTSTGTLVFNAYPGGNTTFDVTVSQAGSTRHVALRAKILWGDGTTLNALSFSPNVASITLSGANTAPAYQTQPSISPASGPVGTVFSFIGGTVSGQPTPTNTLIGLTQNGIDVFAQVSNGQFTSTEAGPLIATWQAVNGVLPNATAQASAAVTTVAQVPGQMAAPTLSVVSASQIDATLAAAPADGGATITSYEMRYSLDQQNWTVLAGLVAGETRALLGLLASTVYYVQTAARNVVGLGPWSPSRMAMTNAASGTTLAFGQYTAIGAGAAAISEADGDYGQFTVASGVATPNASPLSVGVHTIGSTSISVVANEYSVASLAEFTAARTAMGSAGGRTIRFRAGTYVIGADYNLASAAYASRVTITGEPGTIFDGNVLLNNPTNVSVQGIEVYCQRVAASACIYLKGACAGLRIENNYLHGIARDPLGDYDLVGSYQNVDNGVGGDGSANLNDIIVRGNRIEHVKEGVVLAYAGAGPFLIENNAIGYTYSDSFKFSIKGVAALTALKRWAYNRWYMMLGRQDDDSANGNAGAPHCDFLQLVPTNVTDSAPVENFVVIMNTWILTGASRGKNIQGVVAFPGSQIRPVIRNAKVVGNVCQADSAHAVNLQADGGIFAHNTLIRTQAPVGPAPFGKTDYNAQFVLQVATGMAKPTLIRNVTDAAPSLSGSLAAVDEYDSIYLGKNGATIPYATAFANGGVEPSTWAETLANYTLKPGGPLDLTFGRGAYGSGIGTWGPEVTSPAGWTYNAAFEGLNPGVIQPLSIDLLPMDGLVYDCARQTTANVRLTGKGTTGQQVQVRGASAGGNTSWASSIVDAAGNWTCTFSVPEAEWGNWYATEARIGTDDLTKVTEATRLWGCGDVIMTMGQSQVEHSTNPDSYYSRNYTMPAQTIQNFSSITQALSGGRAWTASRFTSYAKGQIHVGMAALAEAVSRVLPNRKILLMDGATSGTSIYDMVNDNESSRLWVDQTYPVDLVRSAGSDLGVIMMMWQANDHQRAKTYAASTAPIFIGQRWNGQPWTLGTPNPDDTMGSTAPIHHILWDCEAPSDQYGRGYFTRDRTKLMILEYTPFNAAPTDVEGQNFTNGVGYNKTLDRPARDQLRLMHADPRFPTIPGMYGPGMHVADYDGGVHPRDDTRWGTPYAGLSYLYPFLMWAGYNITEPKVIGYEAAADGSYVDAVIDMPHNGVLTTLRKFNALAAPAIDPAHRQEVTGFEIRRAGVSDTNRRPVFRSSEAAYPANVRGTVVIQDSGTGNWPNRRARVRITPDVPIAVGDGFDFLRGDGSALLLEPRDYNAELWLDAPIAHIPSLYDAAALYPAYGIPVQPQPPFMTVTMVPAGSTAPAAFTAGQWTLVDKVTNGALTLTLTALPANGGAAITDVQYQIGAGNWISLGGAALGGYTISGLTNGVSASVKIRAVNSVGASAASDTKSATPTGDVTEPVLSTPTDAASGSTGATGSVSTNEAGGTLHVVATTSATSPSAAQVKAGQNHLGAAAASAKSQAVTATGAQTVNLTGLTASTGYWLHFMQEDAQGNPSSVASGDGFTTAAAGFSGQSTNFNGTTSKLASTGLSLVGGNEFTIAGWLYLPTWVAVKNLLNIRVGSTQALTIITTSSGRLQFNPAGVASHTTGTGVFSGGRWHHVMYSVRGGATPRYQFCVDGGNPVSSTPDITGGTLAISGATITRLALGNDNSSGYVAADLGHWWIDLTQSLDLSDPAVRGKFINGKNPVDLGVNGELVTGSPPQFYLDGGATMSNKGTGGVLTATALAAGGTPALP